MRLLLASQDSRFDPLSTCTHLSLINDDMLMTVARCSGMLIPFRIR